MMRGVPDHGSAHSATHHDVRGVALRLHDRVCYCRCGDGGLTLARIVQLAPEIVVFEPDARRYVHILVSRQLVIVEESTIEREVREALRGIGF